MNKRLNTGTKLVFPFTTLLMKNLTFMIVILFFLSILKYIRQILLEPAIWFLIAMMTLFICTGGIVYSVIHGVPWFKFDRDQSGTVYVAEYFMKGQRGQWAGEGYIFSSLVCVCGILWIFVVRLDTLIVRKYNKRIGALIAILSIFMVMQLILLCYRIKSPWYAP